MTNLQKDYELERKFKAGPITATVWKPSEEGKSFLTAIEKSFKDKEGNWTSTNQFTVKDLATVSMLANKAFDYLTQQVYGQE